MNPKSLKVHGQTSMRFTLPSIEESMEAIKKLEMQYSHPKRSTESLSKRTRTDTKGKRRASEHTEEELANLRQGWHDRYQEILQGVPEELPPLRAVNHEINLIDPNKKYNYHLPRCPASVQEEFQAKLNRYINTEWWVPATGLQAAPLMCVPKKDGQLRTIIGARQRNDNMVKNLTPLPDQDIICEDVARTKHRSKVDLADAYEQV
jgi:FtsZ-binding cell division protein ZapB